jgi:predicted dehydrogenase
MHFLPAYMAIAMGKHVFVQKPLTQTIWEARELLRLARRHKVCTQMGNQGHATEAPKQVAEWIRGGVIGDVKEVNIWTNRPIWPQGMKERPTPEQPKTEMDWDLWLGRAATRPYSPAYHTFKWRGWLDFGTGALGDMGCHSIDAPFFAMELGSPRSIIAETSGVTAEAYPDWSIVTYEFPARGQWPAVTLKWYDGEKDGQPNLPPRPKELEQGRKMNRSGQLYYGAKGVMLSQAESASGIRLIPESFMKEMKDKLPEKSLPRVPHENHYWDWLGAIRKGDPHASGTQFEFAVPLTEIVLLGNIALRVPGQKVEWDAKRMRITSHPELNKLVKPIFRKGWEPGDLPV